MEIIIQDKPDTSWDKLLKKSEFGTIYQSKIYASYLQKVQGRKPLFVKFLSDNEIIAMGLFFLSSQFFSRRFYNIFTSSFFKLLSRVRPYYWTMFGPVFISNDHELLDDLLKLLRLKLFKNHCSVKINPHPLEDNSDGYLGQGFNVKPSMTCIINLRHDFDILEKRMNKRSARKNVKRAIKRGVQILEVTRSEDFEMYFRIAKQSRIRHGLRPYTRREMFPALEMIKKDVMKCFLAMNGENPLAGILISTFNGYLNEWGAAQVLEDISGRFYGNDLLRHHIIKWGHYAGHRYYDQSGLSLSTEKDLGIYKYKTKWGGKIIHYNVYTMNLK